MSLSAISDKTLIEVLEARGYVVRHKRDTRPLSWNRTEPMPADIIFEDEALEKIRGQIDARMIRFELRPGGEFTPAIRSATLRVI